MSKRFIFSKQLIKQIEYMKQKNYQPKAVKN